MMDSYTPAPDRYDRLPFRRTGHSGLRLPEIALGLWHNFGADGDPGRSRAMVRRAFDLGITHFDLANNYGPPPGAAELRFGTLLKEDLHPWRDELIIASKAGFTMWDGPYGDGGGRKYLFASLHQSLRRLGLEYLDIFYHHRPDPDTPLAETMQALADMVRQGKALHVGISNYPAAEARRAVALLAELGVPCLVDQVRYSMLEREMETATLPALAELGVGAMAYSPLAGGQLSDRYLEGIPLDSRAAGASPFLQAEQITPRRRQTLRGLHDLARARGDSLSQLALNWVLRHPAMTTALIGASRPEQIEAAVAARRSAPLGDDELARIDALLARDRAA
ncbi:aldo/keto reductase [Zobellella iuensis]|uniref:aldo/keto reductase n=1 Tax=Zobellella iuensis TaxID=2803811 RepID=UPI003F707633